MEDKNDLNRYDWMLALSAEGWAWEFLRRNAKYKSDYIKKSGQDSSGDNARQWGLLQYIDPDIDARLAQVFWQPSKNQYVLSLVIAGEQQRDELSGIQCKTSVLELTGQKVRHVLFSGEGRYLQLAVSGSGSLEKARYMLDALPEHGRERKLLALRRLIDLSRHKTLRPHLYGRQRRNVRLMHLAQVMDSSERNPAHRAIAVDIFGATRTDRDWESVRDHVRRALAAARRLSQWGYLNFLT